MKRLLTLLPLAAGLLGTGPLRAQTGTRMPVYFKETAQGLDTVVGALAGGPATLTLASDNQFGGEGLGRFRVRIYFDATAVSFLDARSSCPDSAANPITTVSGTNFVELSANGCSLGAPFATINVATVRFTQGLATSGSVLYVSPDTLFDFTAVDRTADGEGDVTEVCAATTVWGDVDNDAVVNSRDALIALTNAVGLPTGGFAVAQGDVDNDGRVSSRDALVMLSYAIQLPTAGTRVALPIARFCAPQHVLPAPLYYQTEGSGPAQPGSHGLTIRAASDSVSTVTGDSTANFFNGTKWRPRISPADASVLLACLFNTSTSQICRRGGAGGLTALTAGFPFDSHESPDWSPAGDSIVFIRDGAIYVMAADGSGSRLALSGPFSVHSVAWQPVAASRTIAFTIQGCNGEVRTLNLDTGSGATIAAGDCAAKGEPDMVEWSPAGDSLAFQMFIDNRSAVLVAPATASAPLAKRVTAEQTSTNEPLWRTDGVVFQLAGGLYGQLYFRRNDGTVFRLTRAAADLHFPGITK